MVTVALVKKVASDEVDVLVEVNRVAMGPGYARGDNRPISGKSHCDIQAFLSNDNKVVNLQLLVPICLVLELDVSQRQQGGL